MKICPQCQHTFNGDYLFCPKCGVNLRNCRHCGKELPEEANYCPYCGKSVKVETTILNELPQNSIASKQKTLSAIDQTDKPPISVETVLPEISKEARADIIKRFSQMRNEYISGSENQKWTETTTQIVLSDKWEHWVGHDDTISKTIKLTFSKVWMRVENVPWTTESDWPCSGQALLFDKSKSSGSDDPWDSHYWCETHKAWLLKEPYGLPGLWRIDYQTSNSRH